VATTGKMVIFHQKLDPGFHFEFPIFTKFLPEHSLNYTNTYAKFLSTFATFRARTRKVYGRGGGMTTKP
jgi:hypothetical protein